jgi:hypothetical protein
MLTKKMLREVFNQNMESAFKRDFSNNAGSIRRVVRRGSIFICGLCRDQYDSEELAFECLNECWQEFLSLSPVIARLKKLRRVYRCRFCARDYSQFQMATSCARDCRVKQKAQHETDLQLVDLSALPQRKPRVAKPKAILTMVQPARRIKPKDFEDEQVPSPKAGDGESHKTIEADAVAASGLEVPGVESAGEAAKKKRSLRGPKTDGEAAPVEEVESRLPRSSEKFYRDNAKYACSSCNKRFFTRGEVEQCFDSH